MEAELSEAGKPGSRVVTDWSAIETAIVSGQMSYKIASNTFGVTQVAIRQRAHKYEWVTPRKLQARAKKVITNRKVADAVIAIRQSEIAQHRRKVFNVATASLKSLKKVRITNAKDLDLVDRVGRRAAGINDEENKVSVSLIQLNEAIDTHSDEDVIEAEVLPGNPEPRLPASGNPGSPVPALQDRESAEQSV